MKIKQYTKELIPDVLQFEHDLRSEENFWGWEIEDKYIADVTASFDDPAFANSLSLLAYMDGRVVGRIDSTKICSHFDGSTKAYLDWICVIKSYRHKGVAQVLMQTLRKELKVFQHRQLFFVMTVFLRKERKQVINFPDPQRVAIFFVGFDLFYFL